MKDLTKCGLSERRGCALVGVARSYARYVRRRTEDEELLKELKRLAFRHPRYGYRRAWALLRRGEFYNQETFDGRPVFVRFVFSDITPAAFRLEQAFSADGGRTWEANWIATFRKAG